MRSIRSDSRQRPLRHCHLAASASSCAKAVAMRADVPPQPWRLAWAGNVHQMHPAALPVALTTRAVAVFSPSCALETTSFTRRMLRRASLRRNSA